MYRNFFLLLSSIQAPVKACGCSSSHQSWNVLAPFGQICAGSVHGTGWAACQTLWLKCSQTKHTKQGPGMTAANTAIHSNSNVVIVSCLRQCFIHGPQIVSTGSSNASDPVSELSLRSIPEVYRESYPLISRTKQVYMYIITFVYSYYKWSWLRVTGQQWIQKQIHIYPHKPKC